MKTIQRALATKFVLFFLTALMLVTAAAGAAGIALLESNGLYANSLDDKQTTWYDNAGQYISLEYTSRYAAKWLGQCSEDLVSKLYGDDDYFGMDSQHWQIEIWQDNVCIDRTYNIIDDPIAREFTFQVEYPVATKKSPIGDADFVPDANAPTPLYIYDRTILEDGELVTYRLSYYQSPTYTAKIWMSPEVVSGTPSATLANMYPYRFAFIGVLIAGLLLFAAGLVYLLWSAGVTPDGTIRPAGLNLLPLDIYAIFLAGMAVLYVWMTSQLSNWSTHDGFTAPILTILAISTFAIALILIGFLCALASQIKQKDHFWWKHSVLGFCLKKLGAGLRICGRGIQSIYSMLPALWQWLLTAGVLLLATIVFAILTNIVHGTWYSIFSILLYLSIGGDVLIALYSGYALGKLLTATRKLAAGDFQYKIPTKYLNGCFLSLAQNLNSVSDTALLLARQHLKSERMKTELITNVSHDINTPLTSIINFVDLLQKPHTKEEEAQYLEILSRQSGHMKKLIQDLIDLSKASTGNLQVNIGEVDAVETVNQALGEFSDKLDTVPLEAVFQNPEHPVAMLADGKLTWRVLSNLLSNAVKYAMPHTRLYVSLAESDGFVHLSLKNVSREPLRIPPEELMERFVQGDISRKTEGSGLGLNIAQSLMAVQNGSLELTVEADLFKVTLTFPAANHS